MEWSWDSGIMQIPTDARIANSPRMSLIHEHGKISIGQIRQYERTYIATPTRHTQDMYMLYQALFKSLSKTGRTKIILDRKNYVVNVGGREFCSGTLLMKVILNKMHLETKAAARVIRERLLNLSDYIVKIGYNITKFNVYVKSQKQQLAVKGKTTNDLKHNILKAYSVVPGEDWKAWHGRVQERLDEGTSIKIEDLLEKDESKFKTLVDDKKWNVLSENEKQIVALKAQIRTLNSRPRKKDTRKKKSVCKTREDKYSLLKDKIPINPKKPVTIEGKKFWWCRKATGGNCEKLTRHHPSKCIANFGKMTSEQRKSALKKKKPDEKPRKVLTVKETIIEDGRSSDDDKAFSVTEENVEEVNNELGAMEIDDEL